MSRFTIDEEYLARVLIDLLNTPSPTGDTEWAVSLANHEMSDLGIETRRTAKGSLIGTMPGPGGARALTAHVDTLGAIVAQIKPSGRLKLSPIGGLMWPTVESEGLTVQTRSGRQYRGSLVLENGAAHVNKDAKTKERTADTMEVRLDERTSTADETRLLGIDIGDFVAFDPRVEKAQSGFIRSRFLDDKACVACLLAAAKALRDGGVEPERQTFLHVSNFEEVGHGGADALPKDLDELVVLDMAVVGSGQNGDEYHCSICVKDSSGPYSKELTDRLRLIAEKAGIDLKPDIYPFYGSDGGAYWAAGGLAQVALIGPGVDTSHGYERTHMDALRDTALLAAEYIAGS